MCTQQILHEKTLRAANVRCDRRACFVLMCTLCGVIIIKQTSLLLVEFGVYGGL